MLMGMVKGKKVDQSQRYVNCYIRVGLFDIWYWDKCLDIWEQMTKLYSYLMVYMKISPRKCEIKYIFNKAIKVLRDIIKYLYNLLAGHYFPSILYLTSVGTTKNINVFNIKIYKNLSIFKNNFLKVKGIIFKSVRILKDKEPWELLQIERDQRDMTTKCYVGSWNKKDISWKWIKSK